MPKRIINGMPIYYQSIGAGDPVLLIAGLAADHTAWGLQVPALSASGYRCLLFDNRDSGQTGESPDPSYRMMDMAEDAAGLLQALQISRAHIVGCSMGAMIAQELALARPDLVATLVLAATAAQADAYLRLVMGSWAAMRRGLGREDFARALSVWIMSPPFLSLPGNLQRYLDLLLATPFPQSVAGFLRQVEACLGHDTLDRLERIQAPTLILAGEADILTPVRYAQAMAARIPGAELAVIPGGSHGFPFETPEAFHDPLLPFLDRHRFGGNTRPGLRQSPAGG